MSVIGIDIGGTRLKVGLVNDEGHIVDSDAVPTPTDFSSFKEALSSLVEKIVRGHDSPSAIGIGCKGVIDTQTATVLTQPGTFRFLEGVSFAKMFSSMFSGRVPVFADNDARVALAGEVIWGAARNKQNVLLLTLGTGVGGAVLVDGKIIRGATGAAGLLGHVTIVANGRFCDCGNRGCLETVFSANAIEGEAISAVYRGCESTLTDEFKNDLTAVTCKAVFNAAAKGDPVAKGIRDDAIFALGAALAGLLHVFDPEVVVIGGQIAEAGASLLDPLRAEVGWRSKRFLGRIVPIVLSEVEDKSGIVGAAALTRLG